MSIAGEDRFLSRQAIIDVCDRMIIADHMGLHCQATDVVRTLKHAVLPRQSEWQTPPVLRTDNGPPLIAEAFETACAAYGLEHERIPVATPNKNAFMSRGMLRGSASVSLKHWPHMARPMRP
ncbi:DDE-type integrase/transposase/recombinase [Sulfobacillus thermosulfidooxidans]|uniref:DDE-type integrase/transposase/recombinase n=1 Tax=Sulfobacillus thermosulfidooxidans TaxID=28034 RepID=UPI0015942D96|nr:DDE-type integrase/transposase/recombinase [Sulfobacillus thermosulfidooxidans]